MIVSINTLITEVIKQNKFLYISNIPEKLIDKGDSTQALSYVQNLKAYLTKYGKLPELETFASQNVNFRRSDSNESLKYLYDVYTKEISTKYAEKRFQECGVDGERYSREFIEKVANETFIPSVDVIDYNNFDRSQLIHYVNKVKTNIAFFDETLGGGCFGGEFYLFAARSKVGKTTFLTHVALSVLLKSKKDIVFISNEMPALSMLAKMDGYIGRFNPNVYRTQEITEDVRVKQKSVIETLTKSGKLKLTSKIKSLNDLRAFYLSQENKPDAIFVDAVELIAKMNSSSYHQSLAEVAYGLQEIAVDYNVPVWGTVQVNRSGAGATEINSEMIAGSDSFARAVTALFGISKIEENLLQINTSVFRFGPSKATYVETDYNTMTFTYKKLEDADASKMNVPQDPVVKQTLEEFNEEKIEVFASTEPTTTNS